VRKLQRPPRSLYKTIKLQLLLLDQTYRRFVDKRLKVATYVAAAVRFELRPQVRKIQRPPRSLYKDYVATAAAAGSNIPPIC
jgi:hypothetical protein